MAEKPVPGAMESGEALRSAEWSDGDILLEDYRVIRLLGQGGMGRVYLVETVTPPRLKYAVKILAKRFLQKERMKRLFLRELQTWIDLQSHPNVISCRFFKTIEGRLAIFSEFAEADSLKAWIRSGKTRSMDRILDVAIQAAWGLEAAHRLGVIHLDMKPENILMTGDGTVKITDFGVSMLMPSFADESPEDTEPQSPADTPKPEKHSSGMTPAYASPEQFTGREVTRRSDIWSWGVSILEMFTGRVTWKFGFLADEVLDATFRNPPSSGCPVMPEGVHRLLKRCFAEAPEDRWSAMDEVAGALQQLWSEQFGQPYPRPRPVVTDRTDNPPAGLTDAGSLTHWQSAAQWLATGLHAAGISASEYPGPMPVAKKTPEARAVNDLEIMDTVLRIFRSIPDDQNISNRLCIARLHSDKAAIHEYLGDYSGANEHYRSALAVHESLIRDSRDASLIKDMAGLVGNIANLFYLRGKYDESLAYQKQAIAFLDEVINGQSPVEWINLRARLCFNMAVTCFGLKHWECATEYALKSVRIREDLVFGKHRLEFIENLVQSYSNAGLIYHMSDQTENALEYFDKAVSLIRRSSLETSTVTYARHIAFLSQSKAMALRRMKEYSRALAMYDAAIRILTSLVARTDTIHDHQQLSICEINRGNLLRDAGRYGEADESYARGINRMRVIIDDRGHLEFRVFLAKAVLNRARLKISTGDAAGIREHLGASIRMYTSLILEKKKQDVLRDFSASLDRLRTELQDSGLDMDVLRTAACTGENGDGAGIDRESIRLHDRFEQYLIAEQMRDLLETFRWSRRILGV